jgi:hypothetical protein
MYQISPEWVTAAGTIGLALVAFAAIFTDQIREWIRHPEWKVSFQPTHPDCNRIRLDVRGPVQTAVGIQIQTFVSAETHYIRVRVRNDGKLGAQDVEVSVLEVRHKGNADRVFKPMAMNTPWGLIWAHFASHVLPRLPVGSERHIDIGHVVDPQKRSEIDGEDRPGSDPKKTLFCLAFFVKANTAEYLLDPGEYEIDFRIFAANSKPSEVFTFSLNHTGKWFLDEAQMYRDGLGLSVS